MSGHGYHEVTLGLWCSDEDADRIVADLKGEFGEARVTRTYESVEHDRTMVSWS